MRCSSVEMECDSVCVEPEDSWRYSSKARWNPTFHQSNVYCHSQVWPSFSLSPSPFPLPKLSLHDRDGQELVVVRKDQRLLIGQLSNSRFSALPTLASGQYRRAYLPLSSRSDRKSDLAFFVATLLLLIFAALTLYTLRHGMDGRLWSIGI